jgi:hypothetical protein
VSEVSAHSPGNQAIRAATFGTPAASQGQEQHHRDALKTRRKIMFTTHNYLDTSERAACLVVSMLIVTAVLALGAFGIDSMFQNAQLAQNAQTTTLSVPA